LKAIPSVSQRLPSSAVSAAGSNSPRWEASNPKRPSSTLAGPVAPWAARAAAVIPAKAAQPACSGFVCEPSARNSISPEAWLPAIPSAFAVCSAESPRRRAVAAAAAKTPQTEVGWKPRRCISPGLARPIREPIS
jgi:hypothetical protein